MKLEYDSIGDVLVKQAKVRPDSTVLVFPGSREVSFTYAELLNESLRTAALLQHQGLEPNDRIALVMQNSPEFVVLYFAGLLSGASIVTINPDSAESEIDYILKDSKPKRVFRDEELRYFDLRGIDALRHLSDAFSEYDAGEIEVGIDDEAVVIYTSGTTGTPKGVVLTHRNFLSDAMAISSHFKFNENTRTLCILPLFHNNGQVATLLAPLYVGGSNVIVPGKASLLAFWGLIKKYNVSWTSVMPSILAALLSAPTIRSDNSLDGIICGGQVLTSSVQEKFERKFGVSIYEGYGLTETTSFSCFNSYPSEKRRLGSIGQPLPINEMSILGEDGTSLQNNADGEICIRGANVSKKYLNMQEKTIESHRGGWFHSGDYGFRDSDGYYYIKGRKDSLIIKGGEKLYPAEVENVLYLHPAVAECAVFGVPDFILGQEVCAAIVAKPGKYVSAAELRKFCASSVSKYKVPKHVVFIDEMPKTPTKKIKHDELRDMFIEMRRNNAR